MEITTGTVSVGLREGSLPAFLARPLEGERRPAVLTRRRMPGRGCARSSRDTEIEINNRLLREQAGVSRIGAAVARAVEEVMVSPCASF